MNDCIERAEAIRICERLRDKTDNDDMAFALNWAMQSINNIPAVDVRTVVRGLWEVDGHHIRCSKRLTASSRESLYLFLTRTHILLK